MNTFRVHASHRYPADYGAGRHRCAACGLEHPADLSRECTGDGQVRHPLLQFDMATAREAHRRVMMTFDPSVTPGERWELAVDAAIRGAVEGPRVLGHVSGHSVAEAKSMNSDEGYAS